MKKIFNILAVLLLTGTANAQQLDRSIRPQPAPAKEIDIKDAKTFTLSNGLKVFVVEDNRAPIVYYSLNLDIKPALEENKAGMQNLFTEVMGTATTTRTKEQINKEVDLIGTRLNSTSRGGNIRVLKKYEAKALDLLTDVLFNPVFNESELKLNADKYKSNLAFIQDDAGSIAQRVSAVLTYGKNYPDGEVETPQTIDSVTINDLQNFHNTCFAPNVSRLVIVGNITEAEAKANAEKYFGKWERKDVPQAQYVIPQAPSQTTVALVEKPGAVQSMIDISYPVEYKVGAPNEDAADIMNYILGGSGGTGRLFLNLRETHSYTYGVYSNLHQDELIGRFSLTSGRGAASVKAAVTDSSVYEILSEMNNIIRTPVSEKDLQDAQSFLAGKFGRSLENPSTVAQFAINIDKYNLPKDYYKNYLKRLYAVTPADVQTAAEKYIKPDNAQIVVVGDESCAEGLKHFAADKTVHFYDIDGNPAAASAVAETTDVTPEQIIANYVKALGGVEAINKIDDYKVVGDMAAMGQTMTVTQLFKKPSFTLTELSMNGTTIQKIIFNGTHLKISGMQGSQDLTEGDVFEAQKMDAGVCPEMNYAQNGVEMNVSGIEKINGKDAYVLSVKRGETVSLNYFDKETGLKVKTAMTVKTPTGEIQQSTEYSDYRPVAGVLFPFSSNQSAAGMNMQLTINTIDINTGIADSEFE